MSQTRPIFNLAVFPENSNWPGSIVAVPTLPSRVDKGWAYLWNNETPGIARASNSGSVLSRNNVRTFGQRQGQAMLFAHGYGCDQNMWRMVAPAFQENYRIVLFDHVGFGNSDLSSFDLSKYGTLQGYAHDVLDICRELKLEKVIFVGHSVSSMIGVLAAVEAPELFDKLILIGPSPRYINDADYVGGFTKADIDGLLDFLDSNYLGWSKTMAPVIMQNADRPELAEELANNSHRHGKSKKANVNLSRTSDFISITVADEGIGIPESKLEQIKSGSGAGVGLRGMRERVYQLNGVLDIASSEKGTVIQIRLPVFVSPT